MQLDQKTTGPNLTTKILILGAKVYSEAAVKYIFRRRNEPRKQILSTKVSARLPGKTVQLATILITGCQKFIPEKYLFFDLNSL